MNPFSTVATAVNEGAKRGVAIRGRCCAINALIRLDTAVGAPARQTSLSNVLMVR
jgi:hypothetical protein